MRLDNLSYAYPNGLLAVHELDLGVRAGEVISVVGPSGCGKSTILSLIAGLKTPLRGRITWDEAIVGDSRAAAGRKPARRRLTLVFQQDTVLPWRTVEQNVDFGLRYVALSKEERAERITSLLKLAKMEDFRKAHPKQLSGGMRRRVALLTGVAPLPHLLLLDEPFAALDEPTRVAVHADLLEIIYRLGLAVIMVTHDLAEAITLSDRVIVLSHRPARVAEVFETGMGRPRDVRKVRETSDYQSLYARAWHELWKQTEAGPRTSIPTTRRRHSA